MEKNTFIFYDEMCFLKIGNAEGVGAHNWQAISFVSIAPVVSLLHGRAPISVE